MSRIEHVRIPYVPHPGQRLVHQSKARFRVLNTGRRWGKSNAAIWECFDAAISNPHKSVWYIGPTYKQSKPIWRLAKRKYPKRYIKAIREVEKEIHLINDSIIEFKSADEPDGLRSVGEELILVVFDECSYLKPETWAIMRPALIDNRARALLISTPNGRNWFYDFWLRGQKTFEGAPNPRYNPEWESWKFSSYDNPHVSKEEIDTLIREGGLSPLEISREIYAEFIEAAGYVFSLDAIESCIVPTTDQAEEPSAWTPEDGLVIGLDVARVQNYTVAIVMNREARVVSHKAMQGPWTAQAKTIRHIWERFAKPVVVFDSTGVGDSFKPLLLNEGIFPIKGVDFRRLKGSLIENLKVGIEERQITFPNIPQLVKELQHFEAKETPSGKIDYSAPRGFHDDYVCALALAYWGVSQAERHGRGPSIKVIG